MKKLSILLASLALAVPAFSQSEAEPNRLILKNTIGNTTGYVIDRVDEITFARVDGEVKAEAEITEVALDQLTVSITKTPDCFRYVIDVVPATISNAYNDLTLITYIERNNPQYFWDDYTNGTLSGIELKPATDYVLVTIGYDGYGIADGVVRVPFTTPKPAIIGNPEVTAEVVDTQLYSFSVKFTPNEDVKDFYCVAGEKGSMQSQLDMFGPMMGLSSMTDLIMRWGIAHQDEQVVEWKQMDPNTEYEVYYLATDVNGTPTDYKILELSTAALGGDGEAKVDIEILEYEYSDWYGEMKPSQYIGFTPNDQTSCYRFSVYEAEKYDSKKDEIQAQLKSDPFMPTANWFFYEEMVTDFQIDPETECVAIAAAKNAKGEWGPVNEVRFTTPEKADGEPEAAGAPAASSSSKIKSRSDMKKSLNQFNFTPGKVPAFPKAKKLEIR